ncbi:MAG: hypothetical protein NTZ34_11270 [Chloroflexi bacterium]|nr:hypothetical protein [Chloroflexota bacterium]
MDKNITEVRQLKAVLACDHSDGYLKLWAKNKLHEIEYRELIAQMDKTPVLAA